MMILTIIWYRESYAPIVLEQKAARLRKETGNPNLRSIRDTGKLSMRLFLTALARPLKLLFTSPIVFMMALFAAVTYGYMYLMFTTITSIFEDEYGFGPGIAGLAYLGFGVGCLIGLTATGRVANHIAKDHIKKGCFTPESRLLPMMVGLSRYCASVRRDALEFSLNLIHGGIKKPMELRKSNHVTVVFAWFETPCNIHADFADLDHPARACTKIRRRQNSTTGI